MEVMVNYPSDEILKTISEFKDLSNIHALMKIIKPQWEFPDFGWKQDGEIYYLSTGGWSGNEEIIDAMHHNIMWWLIFWQQSRRGGHYIFSPLTLKNICTLNADEKKRIEIAFEKYIQKLNDEDVEGKVEFYQTVAGRAKSVFDDFIEWQQREIRKP